MLAAGREESDNPEPPLFEESRQSPKRPKTSLTANIGHLTTYTFQRKLIEFPANVPTFSHRNLHNKDKMVHRNVRNKNESSI